MLIFTKYKNYVDKLDNKHDLDMWGFDNNLIYRIFQFKDFKQAIEFINNIANISEDIGHHPDLFLYDYKFVKVSYKSHEKNKVTQDDYKCAHLVDSIYEDMYS